MEMWGVGPCGRPSSSFYGYRGWPLWSPVLLLDLPRNWVAGSPRNAFMKERDSSYETACPHASHSPRHHWHIHGYHSHRGQRGLFRLFVLYNEAESTIELAAPVF